MSDIHAIRRHSAEIIISSRPMNYVMFHHKRVATHTEECVTHRKACHTKKEWHTKGATHMWIKHEINILLQKLDWWQKNRRKRRKSYHLLHQWRCRRNGNSYRSQEAEEVNYKNSLKIWTRCRVLNCLASNSRLHFYWQLLRRILSAQTGTLWRHRRYLPKFVLASRTTRIYASKRPVVTLRNMFGANKNSNIWHNSWEAKIKIANVELRPNYIRESQLAKRGITRTRSTCRRLTQGQQSEWEGREESSTASCMR